MPSPSSDASSTDLIARRLAALRLRRRAQVLAADQAGVLCRRQLAGHRIPRWLVALELRTGRWQRTGRQTVVVHNGALSPQTRRTIALYEVCLRAALDGASALQHAGVTSLTDALVHVIAPKGSDPVRVSGVRTHESRRFREQDVVVLDGVRTVVPGVAAVHAALWARTDREATLFLVLVVQHRLATVPAVEEAVASVRRHARRRLLRRVAGELAGGIRSMGELDVTVAMRRRGLPEPERQVVRRRPSGTEYLDCRFDAYALTLEIDGAQHDDVEHRTADVLRDLAQAAEGDTVLRLPLTVWRLEEQRVLDRLEEVFVARGWRRPAA